MLATEFKLAIIGTLESSLNTYLQLDPDSQRILEKMTGKCLAIELKGLDVTLYLLTDTKGIQIFSDYPDTPDAILSGTPMELLGLALEQQPGPAVFAEGVKISGDTELGQLFKRLFDSLDIDWEEYFSHYTGDIVAHKMGSLLRSGIDWSQQAIDILRQDIAEYLLQEDHLVPEKAELEGFYTDIDTLRDNTERLEARIQRIKDQLANSA
jgi:ubiquinone biosynthesis protein UbiJ